MKRFQNHPAYRYLMSLVITAVASAIQYAVVHDAQIPVPGILYPSTFLVAWYCGFGPALLAVAGSLFASNFLFYEPILTLKLLPFEAGIRLGIFGLTSLVAAWIVSRGKLAQLEQIRAVSALKNLQERFERSAAATNLGIWSCDIPTGKLHWNAEAKEHFWLPARSDMTLEKFYERIHPDDRDRVRAAVEASIQNRMPYDLVYRTTNPRSPKDIKHIRAIGWTDLDVTGKVTRFDGISLDSSQIRLVSAERDESLEVLETINRLGKYLAAELDVEKLVQQVTDAATQVARAEFGAFFYNLVNEQGESYTLYAISGVPREKFSSFPMPRNTAIFAPTFAGTAIVRSDNITLDPRYGKNAPYAGMPTGHLPVTSYMAVPVISRSGEVLGGLFLGHSKPAIFTERDERIVAGLASQAAIAMDNARLFERANRAIRVRDEFLSISSHELRTPLTPLKMQIQGIRRYLEKGTLSDDQLKKMLEISEKQVNRLTALIEDLLDVSRISAGKLNLNREELDASEVVKEVVERYQPQLQSVKCEVRLQLVPSLPASLDRLRFEQVVINLLTNSMKYAAGKPIHVSLAKESGALVLKVVDQGMGISVEDQKRIFGRFERVFSTDHYGGLGLGLFIVNQIVNAHGGSIAVESEAGRGASFTVRIPFSA